MIKLFDSFPRVCALVVLLLGYVVGAQAATITYKLTTHTRTTNQTLTGTANLSTGASLLNNMPQALWRAYCTYTFYSDEAMTQEITTAPSTASYVYVDYVFDPPFILSQEGSDPVWHNFRTYSQQADAYYIFVNSEQNVANTNMNVMGYKDGVPEYGEMNKKMQKEGHAQWAFYGDAYDFHIMVNEDGSGWGDNVWLVPYSNINRARLGAKKTIGWQLLVNKASNNKISGSMMAMQDPESGKFADLNNLSSYIGLSNLDSRYHYLTSKNELASVTTGQSPLTYAQQLWWYAFFATPVTEGSSTVLTTFVIYKAYDYKALRSYWYIKAPQTSNTKKPEDIFVEPTPPIAIPEGYTGLTYTFYKDAALTQPFTGYVSRFASTIYVKESCPQSDHWVTMVSPFTINDVTKYFGSKDDGETPAASVLEYTSVSTTDKGNNTVSVNLSFTETTTMEAHKPYLVKFDEVGSVWLAQQLADNEAANASEDDLVAVTCTDSNVPNVNVSMKGTYDGFRLRPQSSDTDPAYFYFGYNAAAAEGKTPYNFYVVKKKEIDIPAYRCYFYAEGTSGSVNLSMMGITDGIGEVLEDIVMPTPVQGIYNLKGQMVRGGHSVEGLPAGIYVVNGKKLVVK